LPAAIGPIIATSSFMLPDTVEPMAHIRPWLVPIVLALAAAVLFVAGAVVWRMMSPLPRGSAGYGNCPGADACVRFFVVAPPQRLHPLRAELLWTASAVLALAAPATALLRLRRSAPPSPEPSGSWTSVVTDLLRPSGTEPLESPDLFGI